MAAIIAAKSTFRSRTFSTPTPVNNSYPKSSATSFRFCTLPRVLFNPKEFSLPQQTAGFFFGPYFDAILPVAPGRFGPLTPPLFVFARAPVRGEKKPESIFVPQAAFVSLLRSRAPPLA